MNPDDLEVNYEIINQSFHPFIGETILRTDHLIGLAVKNRQVPIVIEFTHTIFVKRNNSDAGNFKIKYSVQIPGDIIPSYDDGFILSKELAAQSISIYTQFISDKHNIKIELPPLDDQGLKAAIESNKFFLN